MEIVLLHGVTSGKIQPTSCHSNWLNGDVLMAHTTLCLQTRLILHTLCILEICYSMAWFASAGRTRPSLVTKTVQNVENEAN